MGTLYIVILIALVAILFVMSGLKVIRQSETKIIERLGRYHSTLSSGINIIWPILDRPRKVYVRQTVRGLRGDVTIVKMSDVIDLREQVYDFPEQSVITKDNVTTRINALLYFQITDPFKSVYEIDNLPNAIEKLTQTTLRNIIGELELDETLTSRDTINQKLRSVLDDATNKWGVKINRVELQDITPPETVRDAMEQQMQAERERRAKILKAEGEKASMILQSEGQKESQVNRARADKESQILVAQGEAEAKILQAEAEAKAIERVAEALRQTNSDPAAYQLAVKYIETLKEMATGPATKTVYLPYEATNVLGSLGTIKELFKQP
ncbi:MAG: SPFH/Band 7/PHB domain protein [Bacteroidales bacterium]|nr:SPFH/Band 7/PHB domain protein [Bacteroidales bacterium]MDD6140187.1 SPFH/Band 7/PHB domain protein [Bacteroidales bacterium]MDD6622104.1 SPFH/Band 7/PHB domain protein [Bacteroidales bacterium]MDD6668209.1 SPFH/Band 7/PHB domain protein [Bacteroidales bacterium]